MCVYAYIRSNFDWAILALKIFLHFAVKKKKKNPWPLNATDAKFLIYIYTLAPGAKTLALDASSREYNGR